MSTNGEMESMGLEPTTSALRTQGGRVVSGENKELASSKANACTSACTDGPDLAHDDPTGANFADALAMVARLPLSDQEKAEAVRRLLAERGE